MNPAPFYKGSSIDPLAHEARYSVRPVLVPTQGCGIRKLALSHRPGAALECLEGSSTIHVRYIMHI